MRNARATEAQKIESSGAQDNSQERARETGLRAKAAAAKLGDTMAAWTVDPRQHVRAMIEWVFGRYKCPDEEAERAIALNIEQLGPRVKDFVERFDFAGLHHELADFANRCERACFPKQTPTLEAQIEACKRRFQDKGYLPSEIGAIRHVAKQGDLIGMIMAASIEINGKQVPRAKLRELITPAWVAAQGLPDPEVSRCANAEKEAVRKEQQGEPKEDPDRYKPHFVRERQTFETEAMPAWTPPPERTPEAETR